MDTRPWPDGSWGMGKPRLPGPAAFGSAELNTDPLGAAGQTWCGNVLTFASRHCVLMPTSPQGAPDPGKPDTLLSVLGVQEEGRRDPAA